MEIFKWIFAVFVVLVSCLFHYWWCFGISM